MEEQRILGSHCKDLTVALLPRSVPVVPAAPLPHFCHHVSFTFSFPHTIPYRLRFRHGGKRKDRNFPINNPTAKGPRHRTDNGPPQPSARRPAPRCRDRSVTPRGSSPHSGDPSPAGGRHAEGGLRTSTSPPPAQARDSAKRSRHRGRRRGRALEPGERRAAARCPVRDGRYRPELPPAARGDGEKTRREAGAVERRAGAERASPGRSP